MSRLWSGLCSDQARSSTRPRFACGSTGGLPVLTRWGCWRCAGFPAGDVLRAAGKREVADLLETLYGRVAVALPDRPGRDLLRRRAALAPALQKALDAILAALAGS